jgi:Flp pilus assembly protein TadG
VIARLNREDGVAAVEMALVMPVLLLLVLGIIDVGRLVSTQVAVQDAAQEGALFAAFAPSSYSTVRDRVKTTADDLGVATNDVQVTCPEGNDGDRIDVTVGYDFDLLTPLIEQMFGDTVRLTKTVKSEIYLEEPHCDPGP